MTNVQLHTTATMPGFILEQLHVVSGGDHTLYRVAGMRDRAILEWFGKHE